jgi:hypothetical protein
MRRQLEVKDCVMSQPTWVYWWQRVRVACCFPVIATLRTAYPREKTAKLSCKGESGKSRWQASGPGLHIRPSAADNLAWPAHPQAATEFGATGVALKDVKPRCSKPTRTGSAW